MSRRTRTPICFTSVLDGANAQLHDDMYARFEKNH